MEEVKPSFYFKNKFLRGLENNNYNAGNDNTYSEKGNANYSELYT